MNEFKSKWHTSIILAAAALIGIAPGTIADARAHDAGGDTVFEEDQAVYNRISELPVRGSLDAPVTIVEFIDFQCGISQRAERTMRELLKLYPNDVRIAVVPFPLEYHENAMSAARAALAAGKQGKYWDMHDIIFQNRHSLYDGFYTAQAKNLGLDVGRFKKDMESPSVGASIQKSIRDAKSAGIDGTPSFLINGTLVTGVLPLDKFKEIIQREIARSQKMKQEKKLVGEALYLALVGDAIGRQKDMNSDNGTVEREENLIYMDISELPMRGSSNALVTMVEFIDYQCPFSQKVDGTIDRLLKKYHKDLRLAVVQMPLMFHNQARSAAKAVLAAGKQGKYWEMHSALFRNYQNFGGNYYLEQAELLGLNIEQFNADMQSYEIEEFISKSIRDAGTAGISGTPSFLINGALLVGALPINKFEDIIDREIARAKKMRKEKGLAGIELYQSLVREARHAASKKEKIEDDSGSIDAEQPAKVYIPLGNAPMLGDYQAPVTIVQFMDFQCPFCRRVSRTIQDLLKEHPSVVRIVFKHFPLSFHKDAKLAHQAAEAAKLQGKFWEFYNLLYSMDKIPPKEGLTGIAIALGLDIQRFERDMNSPEVIRTVENDIEEGHKANISGTPSFTINGTLFIGAQLMRNFENALNRELDVIKSAKYRGLEGNALYEKVSRRNAQVKEENDGTESKNEDTDSSPRQHIPLGNAPMLGNDQAPVTIVQFMDFQCPYCRHAHRTIKELLKRHPSDVRIVFKHLPLNFHKDAKLAHQAAEAARLQGKFWEFYYRLYDTNKTPQKEGLMRIAAELGLDVPKFERDMNSPEVIRVIENDGKEAENAKIMGTPSFTINGTEFMGAQPLDAFEKALNRALEETKSTRYRGLKGDALYDKITGH